MSTATAAAPLTLETSLDVYPGLNRFALDLTRRASSAARFLCPLDLSCLTPSGQHRDPALIDGLLRSNHQWGNDVAALLEPWSRGETVTLIAGQQVGFAGGPLYTLVKVASLLRLREELARRGIPATVFFWLATEDHDLAEVARLTLQTRDGLHEIRAEDRPASPHVVGSLPVPESLRQQFTRLMNTAPAWMSSGLTFRDSFAQLMVSALGPGVVVLVDSLLPELRRSGAPLLTRLFQNSQDLQGLIRTRSEEIRAAGYAPQIEPAADGSYSFLYRVGANGERRPLLAHEEMPPPESISTGVLTRPLLQDSVFRPDVFVGGPAELAYYAQLAALHDRLGIPQPQVALRGHALVAPAKVLRAVERYELKTEELFLPVDDLISLHETHAMARLAEILSGAESRIEEQLQQVRSFIAWHDVTMIRAVDHSLRKIRHQFRRVAERGKKAIARRDAERFHAIRRLSETLVPRGEPQDRGVAWVGYWLQYGKHLVDRLVAEVEPGTDRLKILGL